MSVNDLVQYADSLLDRAEFWGNVNIALPGEVDDLEDEIHILKNAWHPVSQPPTVEDGDVYGEVVYAYCKSGEWHSFKGRWHGRDSTRSADMWARTRDVVLNPPTPLKPF